MTIDRVTNSVAVASVFSQLWLPSLADVSQTAALLLPIAGLGWLIIQIIWKVTGRDQ
ncbi:hypothetical protein LB553_01250 [Mesorhizobium sp. CA8]|uniref:hypothetical protein n=1 Tax=Mesorhizobium sp. CA8 TaxID=2876637 RepID=UPI001CCFC7C1|nr:hypothetical protein [Mesorhizobium sp. CA8]MBZ9759513.1 hypothetical protein [Mesorhizobium sp. CA8]